MNYIAFSWLLLNSLVVVQTPLQTAPSVAAGAGLPSVLQGEVPALCEVASGLIVEKMDPVDALGATGVMVGDILIGWNIEPTSSLSPILGWRRLDSYRNWLEMLEQSELYGPVNVKLIRQDLVGVVTIRNFEFSRIRVRPKLSDRGQVIFATASAAIAKSAFKDLNLNVELRSLIERSNLAEQDGEISWIAEVLAEQCMEASLEEMAFDILVEVASQEINELHQELVTKRLVNMMDAVQPEAEVDESLRSRLRALESVGEKQLALGVARALARRLGSRGELSQAAGLLEMARDRLFEAATSTLVKAEVEMNLGYIYLKLGRYDDAEDRLGRGSTYLDEIGHQGERRAYIESYLGELCEYTGRWSEADLHFTKALEIRQRMIHRGEKVARSLISRAGVRLSLGQLDAARKDLETALEMVKAGDDNRHTLGRCLNVMGDLALMEGKLDETGYYLNWAYEINKALRPGSLDTAVTSANLAILAFYRDDRGMAREWVRRSMEVLEKLEGGYQAKVANLNILGNIAQWELKNAEAELYFREALDLTEKYLPGIHVSFDVRHNYITALVRQGKLDQASRSTVELIETLRVDPGKERVLGGALVLMAHIAAEKGDVDLAATSSAEALTILRKQASPDSQTVRALQIAAGLAAGRGDSDSALKLLIESVSVLDLQLRKPGGTYESRAGVKDRLATSYGGAIDLLLKLNRADLAFGALERLRSTMFLSMIAGRDLALEEGAPDIQARRILISQELDSARVKLRTLEEFAPGSKAIEKAKMEIRELQVRSGDLKAVSQDGRAYLSDSRHLDIQNSEVWSNSLEPGLLVLSFYVSSGRVGVFVAKNGLGVKYFELDRSAGEIRNLVRMFEDAIVDSRNAGGVLAGTRRQGLDQLALEAGDSLLGPVDNLICQSERILVVPDSFLHMLPFGALRLPSCTEEGTVSYLSEVRPTFFSMSAKLYLERQTLFAKRANALRAKPWRLAVFGNPVYGKSEPAAAGVFLPVAAAAERGYLDFSNLNFSLPELESIEAIFAGNMIERFVGKEATEGNLRGLSGPFDVVHFSAHARVDSDFPLNSFVALTIGKPQSKSNEDGLIQAWEVFEEIRLDTNLLVLAACETGLGKHFRGEGLVGLTRAFQYAGARSVLASIWEVEDEATSVLMTNFYSYLNKGFAKVDALRAAQMDLIENPVYITQPDGSKRLVDVSSPYYWAAFQLYGDWQ